LGIDPMERIADYGEFLERLKNIPVTVRLRNQGRLTADDLAEAAAGEKLAAE
jgi:hypothetical protein